MGKRTLLGVMLAIAVTAAALPACQVTGTGEDEHVTYETVEAYLDGFFCPEATSGTVRVKAVEGDSEANSKAIDAADEENTRVYEERIRMALLTTAPSELREFHDAYTSWLQYDRASSDELTKAEQNLSPELVDLVTNTCRPREDRVRIVFDAKDYQ